MGETNSNWYVESFKEALRNKSNALLLFERYDFQQLNFQTINTTWLPRNGIQKTEHALH